MKTRLSKIIDEAASRKKNEDKVATLQRYDSPQLRELLAYALNPNIEFKLPDTEPPYTPTDGINLEEKLYNSIRKFENLVGVWNGQEYTAVKKMRLVNRERIFIDILEEVHPEDAKLVLKVKDKDIGIKPKIAKDAFPGFFQF